MLDRAESQEFEDARPRLLGLAYRILGSLADAEDAVQDTYLKWARADREAIENKPAWLASVCTRRCLDLLRSAHRSRVTYVGEWLPEPVQTTIDSDVESQLDLASSLTTAFLLVLERLTPKERAAYLLHEIFEQPYSEVAETLDVRETTCRKLVSRAKANIDRAKVRSNTPLERQDQLLAAFQSAIESGVTAPLATLLSDDIRLSADGGGKAVTILEVLHGRDQVMAFLLKGLHKFWAGYRWIKADINNTRGFILEEGDAVAATVTFAYDQAGRVSEIFIMRNPDKLANLGLLMIH